MSESALSTMQSNPTTRETPQSGNGFLRHIRNVWILSLCLTVGQILLFLAAARLPLQESLYGTTYFDASWIVGVVDNGYQVELPLVAGRQFNIVFLPALPLLAKVLVSALHLSSTLSVILVSQLACWMVWLYFLLFLRRWQTSFRIALMSIVALFAFPSTFFLVNGYSESLFIGSLLGAMYWLTHPVRPRWLLAGIHGLVVSSSRMVGLPLAILPLLYWLIIHRNTKSSIPNGNVFAALGSSLMWTLGTSLFFLYCQLKFGQWNVYFQVMSSGWKAHVNFLNILNPNFYRIYIPSLNDFFTFIADLHQLIVPLFALAFLGLALRYLFIRNKIPEHTRAEYLLLFSGAFILFFSIVSAGTIMVNGVIAFIGMIRYILPLYVLLLLLFVGSLDGTRQKLSHAALLYFFIVSCITLSFLILQIAFIHRYMKNWWVS